MKKKTSNVISILQFLFDLISSSSLSFIVTKGRHPCRLSGFFRRQPSSLLLLLLLLIIPQEETE